MRMKKKTSKQESIRCRKTTFHGNYIRFHCSKSRNLDCWVRHSTLKIWTPFSSLEKTDVEHIKALIFLNLEAYWDMGHPYGGGSTSIRNMYRCVTVYNPSWHREIKK